jgi:hypothetical protein
VALDCLTDYEGLRVADVGSSMCCVVTTND